MNVEVSYIESEKEMEQAFAIRRKVFVEEQGVPEEDEWDVYEKSSRHFLARLGEAAVGTARWRFTDKGIKLERFAVLKEARGKKVGAALVMAVLQDLAGRQDVKDKTAYLHAQTSAYPFYAKLGFAKEGDIFVECDIEHYLMKYTGNL